MTDTRLDQAAILTAALVERVNRRLDAARADNTSNTPVVDPYEKGKLHNPMLPSAAERGRQWEKSEAYGSERPESREDGLSVAIALLGLISTASISTLATWGYDKITEAKDLIRVAATGKLGPRDEAQIRRAIEKLKAAENASREAKNSRLGTTSRRFEPRFDSVGQSVLHMAVPALMLWKSDRLSRAENELRHAVMRAEPDEKRVISQALGKIEEAKGRGDAAGFAGTVGHIHPLTGTIFGSTRPVIDLTTQGAATGTFLGGGTSGAVTVAAALAAVILAAGTGWLIKKGIDWLRQKLDVLRIARSGGKISAKDRAQIMAAIEKLHLAKSRAEAIGRGDAEPGTAVAKQQQSSPAEIGQFLQAAKATSPAQAAPKPPATTQQPSPAAPSKPAASSTASTVPTRLAVPQTPRQQWKAAKPSKANLGTWFNREGGENRDYKKLMAPIEAEANKQARAELGKHPKNKAEYREAKREWKQAGRRYREHEKAYNAFETNTPPPGSPQAKQLEAKKAAKTERIAAAAKAKQEKGEAKALKRHRSQYLSYERNDPPPGSRQYRNLHEKFGTATSPPKVEPKPVAAVSA